MSGGQAYVRLRLRLRLRVRVTLPALARLAAATQVWPRARRSGVGAVPAAGGRAVRQILGGAVELVGAAVIPILAGEGSRTAEASALAGALAEHQRAQEGAIA